MSKPHGFTECWLLSGEEHVVSALAQLRPAFSLLTLPVLSPSVCHSQECSSVPGALDSLAPYTCCLICKTAQRPTDLPDVKSVGSSQLSAGGFAGGPPHIITIF